MKKIKLLKLFTSIFMSLAMIFSLNIGIQAAGLNQSTQSVTIKGLDNGTSVSIYKLIDLNISDNDSVMNPMYSWTSGIATWINTNHSTYINTTNSNEVTSTYTGLTSDNTGTNNENELTLFYQKVASAIRAGSLSSLKAVDTQSAANNSVTFAGLRMGQYIVLASSNTDATKIYYPVAINVLPKKQGGGLVLDQTKEANMKSSPVDIKKQVNDHSVGVGDTVEYKLSSDIPVYPENVTDIHYVIGDKLSAGLTIDTSSIKVYNNDESSTLSPGTDYILNTSSTEKATFTVAVQKSYLTQHAGEKIHVKYSAKVNKNAVVSSDNLKNNAYLEFNSDPFNTNNFATIPVEEKVYTYSIEFNKKNEDSELLENAEFTLTKDGQNLSFDKNSDGEYTLSDTQSGTATMLTSSNGKFVLKGLDEGSYILTEKKSPDGYILPNGSATIILVANENGQSLDADQTKVEGSYTIQNSTTSGLKFTFDVVNNKAGDFNLPVTGGMGTMVFTVVGVLVMVGGILLFLYNKKKEV